jgi:hypothetical protein
MSRIFFNRTFPFLAAQSATREFLSLNETPEIFPNGNCRDSRWDDLNPASLRESDARFT